MTPTTQEMNWKALKEQRCPKCFFPLKRYSPNTAVRMNGTFFFLCELALDNKCDFRITQKRYESLVRNI